MNKQDENITSLLVVGVRVYCMMLTCSVSCQIYKLGPWTVPRNSTTLLTHLVNWDSQPLSTVSSPPPVLYREKGTRRIAIFFVFLLLIMLSLFGEVQLYKVAPNTSLRSVYFRPCKDIVFIGNKLTHLRLYWYRYQRNC